jgi:hypothetical protein
MNKLKLLALAAVGMLTLSVQATGDTYFGVGVAKSNLNDNILIGFGYKTINWKALVGQRIGSNWAVEGQHTNYAKSNITNNGAATTDDMSGSSFVVSGLYHFIPKGADYSPFIKFGYNSWRLKTTGSIFGVSKELNDTDFLYGVGLDGKINETMKYRVEFERIDAAVGNMDIVGAALLFGF